MTTTPPTQSSMDPLTDFVELNFTGGMNMEDYTVEMDELLMDMPPSPLNWDSRSDQDSVDNFYLYNVSEFRYDDEDDVS